MKEEYSNQTRRWYDKDPVISKSIELLRVVPVNVQRSVSEQFLKSLEKIDKNGQQQPEYNNIELENLPIKPVKDENGEDLIINI